MTTTTSSTVPRVFRKALALPRPLSPFLNAPVSVTLRNVMKPRADADFQQVLRDERIRRNLVEYWPTNEKGTPRATPVQRVLLGIMGQMPQEQEQHLQRLVAPPSKELISQGPITQLSILSTLQAQAQASNNVALLQQIQQAEQYYTVLERKRLHNIFQLSHDRARLKYSSEHIDSQLQTWIEECDKEFRRERENLNDIDANHCEQFLFALIAVKSPSSVLALKSSLEASLQQRQDFTIHAPEGSGKMTATLAMIADDLLSSVPDLRPRVMPIPEGDTRLIRDREAASPDVIILTPDDVTSQSVHSLAQRVFHGTDVGVEYVKFDPQFRDFHHKAYEKGANVLILHHFLFRRALNGGRISTKFCRFLVIDGLDSLLATSPTWKTTQLKPLFNSSSAWLPSHTRRIVLTKSLSEDVQDIADLICGENYSTISVHLGGSSITDDVNLDFVDASESARRYLQGSEDSRYQSNQYSNRWMKRMENLSTAPEHSLGVLSALETKMGTSVVVTENAQQAQETKNTFEAAGIPVVCAVNQSETKVAFEKFKEKSVDTVVLTRELIYQLYVDEKTDVATQHILDADNVVLNYAPLTEEEYVSMTTLFAKRIVIQNKSTKPNLLVVVPKSQFTVTQFSKILHIYRKHGQKLTPLLQTLFDEFNTKFNRVQNAPVIDGFHVKGMLQLTRSLLNATQYTAQQTSLSEVEKFESVMEDRSRQAERKYRLQKSLITSVERDESLRSVFQSKEAAVEFIQPLLDRPTWPEIVDSSLSSEERQLLNELNALRQSEDYLKEWKEFRDVAIDEVIEANFPDIDSLQPKEVKLLRKEGSAMLKRIRSRFVTLMQEEAMEKELVPGYVRALKLSMVKSQLCTTDSFPSAIYEQV